MLRVIRGPGRLRLRPRLRDHIIDRVAPLVIWVVDLARDRAPHLFRSYDYTVGRRDALEDVLCLFEHRVGEHEGKSWTEDDVDSLHDAVAELCDDADTVRPRQGRAVFTHYEEGRLKSVDVFPFERPPPMKPKYDWGRRADE